MRGAFLQGLQFSNLLITTSVTRKTLPKLPKNDITRKMKDFNIFTRIT